MHQRIVKLRFDSGLHLGEAGIGLEGCSICAHSDTLFSGLCNAWASVYEEIDSLLLEFSDAPTLYLSSAFPFEEKEGATTYYLPKPLLPARLEGDKERRAGLGKILKEMEFIPLNLFNQWIQGDSMVLELEELKGYKEGFKSLFSRYTLPRVQLDRITSASGIYHFGLVRFKEGTGLYFVVRFKDEKALSRLQVGLEVLSEVGLGGERSSGYGRFTFELIDEDLPLRKPVNPDAYVTLSLYYPHKEELSILKGRIDYELIERKGWIDSSSIRRGYKRRPCWMFKEGSVFPQIVKGDIPNVTPGILENRGDSHKIYRYGLPFLIEAKRQS
jgi:CRISPR-associated protein Csm4